MTRGVNCSSGLFCFGFELPRFFAYRCRGLPVEMEVAYMQITKIIEQEDPLSISKKRYLSMDTLQGEFNYYRAERILNEMLKMGLIIDEEFDKIMFLNRETFSPILAQIMPDIT